MRLSMDAFLTPIETPNQAIERTAGRAAFPLSIMGIVIFVWQVVLGFDVSPLLHR